MSIWLQQQNGVIRFLRNNCFTHLGPNETYTLMTRLLVREDEQFIDLTSHESPQHSRPRSMLEEPSARTPDLEAADLNNASQPSQGSTLEAEDSDTFQPSQVTTSSPSTVVELNLSVGAQPLEEPPSIAVSDSEGSESEPSKYCYMYICCKPAQSPVKCTKCTNVMGCFKHVLQLVQFTNRCPICKDNSVLTSCIAHLHDNM